MAVHPSSSSAAAAERSAPQPDESLIDLREVCRRTGLSRSTIQRLIAAGTFPKRIKVTGKLTRWRRIKIEEWIQDRIAASLGPGR